MTRTWTYHVTDLPSVPRIYLQPNKWRIDRKLAQGYNITGVEQQYQYDGTPSDECRINADNLSLEYMGIDDEVVRDAISNGVRNIPGIELEPSNVSDAHFVTINDDRLLLSGPDLADEVRKLIRIVDQEFGRRWVSYELRALMEEIEILIGDREEPMPDAPSS